MQFHWSDFDSRDLKPSSNDSCESLAPFVMALFDGEADENQARRARAHLLICQQCANRWLDWNRSRDLLCAVPVPAPPPTQLWRVLMACRLAAFARQKSPRRANFAGAPTDLHSQILARTTRPAAMSPVSRVQKRRNWTFLSLPSLAAPAVALWLLALQRDAFFVSPSAPTESAAGVPSLATPAAPAPIHAISAAPSIAPRRAISLPVEAKTSEAKTSAAKMAPISAPQRVASSSIFARRDANRQNPSRAEIRLEKSAPRVAFTAFSPRLIAGSTRAPRREIGREVGREIVAANPLTAANPTRAALARAVSAPISARGAKVEAPRGASLSDETNEPRLRAARWQTSSRPTRMVEISFSDARPSRVSLPSSPPPAPTATVLLAENWEDDSHIEEMRSAVDDLRAALAPESPESDG